LQPKLLDQLQKAKMHKEQAEMLCRQASKRRTRNALRPAINKVTQFLGTLGSRKAKTISPTAKGTLRTSADAIRADMQTLQRAVQCPQDAPPGVASIGTRGRDSRRENGSAPIPAIRSQAG